MSRSVILWISHLNIYVKVFQFSFNISLYRCDGENGSPFSLYRNFRENRFFTPWNRPRYVEQYNLPPLIQQHQGKRQIPIGDVILSLNDTTVAAETCEELFTPQAPHINMFVSLAAGLDTMNLLTLFQGPKRR